MFISTMFAISRSDNISSHVIVAQLLGHVDHEGTRAELEKEESDRLQAKSQYESKRARLKAKREAKLLAERQRAAEEKQALEAEIEELRQSVQTTTAQSAANDRDPDSGGSSSSSKRAAKMKKKYEKRIQSLQAEMEDMHQEFQLERERLIDSITESGRDCQLYEQICQALLAPKDLKKVMMILMILLKFISCSDANAYASS